MNPAHLHLMLTHAPVVGLGFALALLGWGGLRKNPSLAKAGFVALVIISTIIMALIIYTLTLDKLHDIAMLKLIGARNGVIVGLILQEALLIGALAYGLAWWLGQSAFPKFPRLVVIQTPDLVMLAAIVLVISVLASLLGIAKAMHVEPNKVLA